jgi:hypothetical protein
MSVRVPTKFTVRVDRHGHSSLSLLRKGKVDDYEEDIFNSFIRNNVIGSRL